MSNENHDPEDDDDLSFSLPRAEDEWVDHVALIRRDHLRLDQFLQTLLPDITRSMAQKLIDDGRVMVNGRLGKPSTRIRHGDKLRFAPPPPPHPEPIAEEIPLEKIGRAHV